jgi:hypothetical protein
MAAALPPPNEANFYKNLVVYLECVKDLVTSLDAVSSSENDAERETAKALVKSSLLYLLHSENKWVLKDSGKRKAAYFAKLDAFPIAKRVAAMDAVDIDSARELLVVFHGYAAQMAKAHGHWPECAAYIPNGPSHEDDDH